MIYLASPYSDPEAAVREQRYKEVAKVAFDLNRAGLPTISPIAHWHPVALDHGLPTDAATWATVNRGWLEHSKVLSILALSGWYNSKGVMLEHDWANELGIPTILLRPKDKHLWEERLRRYL